MTNIILAFLCFLPFSGLIPSNLHMWVRQGYFAQGGILLLYTAHLYKKCKPLALLFGWIGLLTMYYFIDIHIKADRYLILLFLAFFNFICAVVLFDVLTTHAKKEFYDKFIKYFSVTFILVLVYCLLQKLGLDQFYHSIDPGIKGNNKEVVGIMGNHMHNSHFIAMCFPVLFSLKGEIRKFAILFALLMVVLTGSTSGLVVSLIVLLFGQVFLKMFTTREIILSGVFVILAIVYKFNSNIIGAFQVLSNSSGRFAMWKEYYSVFNLRPITGWGLGMVSEFSKKNMWNHVHLEYYQLAIECGVIGLGLALWGIVDYFRRFTLALKDTTTVIMASMFLAFLLTALFGYPAHLWVLSCLAVVAYSYMYRIA